ncbi:MAG TPA: hypothetical protein VHW60_01245 [Caulobacteraceae bacterium]|nr:hypothetical protein [Caulobacteraceae bacterium]
MVGGILDPKSRDRLLALAAVINEKFSDGDWLKLGALTGSLNLVRDHPRLLRSLSWGDNDYEGNVHAMLHDIANADIDNIGRMESFVATTYGGVGQSISTERSKARAISFTPAVFDTPEGGIESDLVAVMMPFRTEFDGVFQAISAACSLQALRCLRAKDIWENSLVIQDIFALIFRAQVVVCDFTGRNANVFYEAGIAHTLGKSVVPITQSASDIPFDIAHHRHLAYLNNRGGLSELTAGLADRLTTLTRPRLRPWQL